MAFPFKPNCTSAWNGTVYNVQTDTAYTFAVSTASIRQYKMGLIFAQNLVKLLMYENYNQFQSCQRYCLQNDIAKCCECFHPNLVQARMNTTFGMRPCLITPSEDSNILILLTGLNKQFLIF